MRRLFGIAAVTIAISVGLSAALLRAEGASAGLAESPIADAAARGDREAVIALLKKAADVNAAQGDGMTALHWAAMNGDAELAEMLIIAGANVRAGSTSESRAFAVAIVSARSSDTSVSDLTP